MDEEFVEYNQPEEAYEEPIIEVPSANSFVDLYTQDLAKARQTIAQYKGLQRRIVTDQLIVQLYERWVQKFGFKEKQIKEHLDFQECKADVAIKTEYTFRELMAAGKEAGEWLVPGLMQPGTLTINWGLPKSGKTTFTQALMKSVLITGELIGVPVLKGKVIDYQLEQSVGMSASKMADCGFDDDAASFLNYTDVYKHKISFNLLEDLGKLEEEVFTFKPRLVIFDSFRAMLAGTGISEYSFEATALMYQLQRVFTRSNFTAGVVLQHQNKSKESGVTQLAGHNGLAGACDLLINFKKIRNKDGEERVEMTTIPRNGVPRHLVIAQKFEEGGRWSLEIETEHNINQEVRNMSNRIIRVLISRPYSKYTSRQIKERLGINNSTDYEQALIDLKRMCLISVEKVDRDFIYSMPETSAWFDNESGLLAHISNESRLADALVKCKTRQDLRIFTKEWTTQLKQNVVKLLSDSERELVRTLSTTCPYSTGDEVVYNGLIVPVVDTKFDTQTKIFYFLLQDNGDEWISEDDLSANQPQIEETIEGKVEEVDPQDTSLF